MKFYKIRHKSSGLFLKPARHSYTRNKNNMSEKGKAYSNKPTLRYYKARSDDDHLSLYVDGKIIKYPEEDFEIVTYETKEV